MRKLFLISALIAAMVCWNVLPAQATIMVEFNPSATDVVVGDIFFVDLVVDIPLQDAILGWGLDLVYDNTQMSWDSLIFGPLWNPVPTLDGDGLAGLATFPPVPISGDDVLLATLDFQCLALGVSQLDVDVTPLDLTEGFIMQTGQYADWTSTPATVSQTPVPEPSTFFLIGTGLAGIAVIRRRAKKR